MKETPRQQMEEQNPHERIKNFAEVPHGYTEERARTEASRCLQCRKPKCVEGCPVNIDIPAFIGLVADGRFLEAAATLMEANLLPAVCGRVCPQETQCEEQCVLAGKGDPVAIGNLERFVADHAREHGGTGNVNRQPPNGLKIAVVGSGPAGLTVAAELARNGCAVTVFEALHKTGGVLAYGIPEFRLPKAIVQAEVDNLKKLGVEIVTNFVVGRTRTIDELMDEDGYNAVFVGSGAGLPSFLNIEGENLCGVYSANEYLLRVNLMKAYEFLDHGTPILRGGNVVVIGGGNVAMDSARSALRLGADNVAIVYRRSRNEMPARAAEIHHAEEEGIELKLLTNPVRFIGNEKGHVTGMECVRMELGKPDKSGRARPVPVEGSEFVMDIDTAVVAIGNSPNPLIPQTTDIKTGKWGNIEADPESGRTSKEGVYAGGDIVTGAATVIEAMGAGKKAAAAILEDLL